MDDLRDKYLQGKLSESERKSFEEGLSKEERSELAFELGVREGLEEDLRKELRETVSGFEEKKGKTRRLNPVYVSIAATVVIAASLLFYFSGNSQSLFDQYYEVYPNYELTTVRGEEDLSSREKAYRSYDMGDYAGGIAAFNELDSMVGADYFFRGMCFIQVQSYEEAILDLSNKMLSVDKDYSEAARWYTALIHLKMKNDDKALPLLRTLSNGNSEFAQTSSELLSML
ncbi:MAG: hypothetical protein AAF391_04730 [Bacteroidota bacterium]